MQSTAAKCFCSVAKYHFTIEKHKIRPRNAGFRREMLLYCCEIPMYHREMQNSAAECFVPLRNAIVPCNEPFRGGTSRFALVFSILPGFFNFPPETCPKTTCKIFNKCPFFRRGFVNWGKFQSQKS